MASPINYIGDVNPIAHGGVIFLDDGTVVSVSGVIDDTGMVELTIDNIDDLVWLYDQKSEQVDSACGYCDRECPHEKAYNYLQTFGSDDPYPETLKPHLAQKRLFGILASMKRKGFITKWRV